ncbi:hypothetical protein XELAEV_18006336mg [Xenopus laevis]|uniref:Uncharacterized protein n=1 Tax=Xenopus laevis TaxID=8355 RepID=A0A974E0Z7_XENLA|nr:hypothetical protein XELAEV_18006336mg [Xenopus laevis]
MFPCYDCNQCPYVIKGKDFVHPICLCLSVWSNLYRSNISQHRSSINLGNTNLPVPGHFIEQGHNTDQLKFMLLETVPPIKGGGDRELHLSPKGLHRDYDLYLV